MDQELEDMFFVITSTIYKNTLFTALLFKQGQLGRPLTDEEIDENTSTLLKEHEELIARHLGPIE